MRDTASSAATVEYTEKYPTLSVRRAGHVLVIGLNRPGKRNAFNIDMLHQLALAEAELDEDGDLWAGVLYSEGSMFTAGLDLSSVAPLLAKGESLVPEGGLDPWQLGGRRLRKPLVVAVHGRCLTLGIELALTGDIVVAADSALFAQLEVARGIFPFGGATMRFPQATGWANAMRWMLTAEEFGAAEAHRIGLVQEVVADGAHVARAVEIAQRIAGNAPLGVQAALRHARHAVLNGEAAAEQALPAEITAIFATEDSRRGVEAFMQRSTAEWVGR
jgi:enoyl-CoA hydratase/carnithine racemase